MRKKWINYLLVAFSIGLYSCEYELESANYVELKKPENPVVNVTLNAPENEKGEYVIRYPHVKYKVEMPDGYESYQVYFSSESVNMAFYEAGHIYFFNNNGAYPTLPLSLKCNAIILQDTAKSIAEISGYEYLETTFEWKIVFDIQPTPQLNITGKKTGDKTFRLEWKEPDTYYGEVDYYEVYIDPSNESHSFTNTNELFYDITLSGSNYFHYRVTAHFKGNYLSPLSESGYEYLD